MIWPKRVGHALDLVALFLFGANAGINFADGTAAGLWTGAAVLWILRLVLATGRATS